MNAILSQVSELLKANGIVPPKDAVITATLKALTELGVPPVAAGELVLGEGFAAAIQAALSRPAAPVPPTANPAADFTGY